MKDWLKHGQGAKHCFPLKFTVCAVTSSKEFCHLLPNNGTPLAPCYLACPSRWEHVTTNTKALIHRRGILSSPTFSLVREPTTTSSLAAISGRRRKNESLLPPPILALQEEIDVVVGRYSLFRGERGWLARATFDPLNHRYHGRATLLMRH